jgi:alkanesulfonate monooxygenase SsuD/methylene tetrahydromethanopterin reductase-like flavin-dependent oxidoreductase (luciferase family)
VTRLGLWLRGSRPAPRGAERSDVPPGLPSVDPDNRSGVVGPSMIDRMVDLVGVAAEAGFDSVWVTDQDSLAISETGGPMLEAYSLLGALATRTTGVRLGAIPVGLDSRAPSIVAKMVTGIDVISHGRAILTYGLGGADDPVRGARVTEAIRVGRALLEDEAPTFGGTFYSVLDARNKPGPVQMGGIPVVVSVEQLADLATVAVTEFVGLADAVLLAGPVEEVRRVVEEVRSMSSSSSSATEASEGVGSLQLIGVVPMPAVTAASSVRDSHRGPTVPEVVAAVRDLLDAGLDGCIVALAITTPFEVLTAIGAGLAYSTEPSGPGTRGGGDPVS